MFVLLLIGCCVSLIALFVGLGLLFSFDCLVYDLVFLFAIGCLVTFAFALGVFIVDWLFDLYCLLLVLLLTWGLLWVFVLPWVV